MINNNKKEKFKKHILKNILKKNKQEGGFCQAEECNKINKQKGGFCPDPLNDSCSKINIKVNPTNTINNILNTIVYPINFLTKLFFMAINYCIKYWNDNIITLSTIFENFIINIIFSVNGYIKITNILLDEIKTVLKIFVAILTNANPIVIMAIYSIPVINELSSFFMDGITLEIFTSLFNGDLRPLTDFGNSLLNLFLGKTVKNSCNKEDYSSKSEMNSNCHQWNVPSCRLNIGTMYTIGIVFWTTIYVACWFSFLKIFYTDDTSSTNIIVFLRKSIYKK